MSLSVILKGMKNGKYVGAPSGWTGQAEKARAFGSPSEALFYCCQNEVWDVAILTENAVIPLTEYKWDGAARLTD